MMNRSNPKLHRELVSFPLDDPQSTLRFSDRLTRENGEAIDDTQRVIFEDQRFLYLSLSKGDIVPPDLLP